MPKRQPTPTSFEATASIIERLYAPGVVYPPAHRSPADNAAVIFSAVIQTRAIDRLTKAVERNTRAVMLAGKMDPEDGRLLDSPKWPVP
jgi:hypothetical protein